MRIRSKAPGLNKSEQPVEAPRRQQNPEVMASLATLSDYELRNLPRHCVEANRVDDLHRLLSLTSNGANVWFEVKDARGMGTDYLADLELARRLGHDDFTRGKGAEALGRAVQYALIGSTLSQFSSNLPVVLLDALVRSGMWSVEHAAAYARNISIPVQYPVALAAIVRYVDQERARSLVDEVLRSIKEIGIPVTDRFHEDRAPTDLRVGVIIDILPIIPEVYLPEFLQLLSRTNEWQVMIGGAEIAKLVPPQFLSSIMSWASHMRPINAANFALVVARKYADTSVERMLYEVTLKNASADESCYEEEYLELLALLSSPLRQRLCHEVLEFAVGRLRDEAILALARYSHEFPPAEALQFRRHTRSVKSSRKRFEIQAIAWAAGAKRKRLSADTLRRLSYDRQIDIWLIRAINAPPSAKTKYIDRALEIAGAVRGARSHASALAKIAQLSQGHRRHLLLSRALDKIAEIDNDSQRAGALDDIIPNLGGKHFRECLSIFQTITEYHRTLCKEGYFHGSRIGVPCTTSALADSARSTDLDALIEVILRMTDPRCRTVALSAVLPKLSGARLKQVARECLVSARTIGDQSELMRSSSWLSLFDRGSREVRTSRPLPYLMDRLSAGDDDREEYDDPGEWLNALNHHEARANLSECYLRHYCRRDSKFDPANYGGLLRHLSDGRKRVLVRIISHNALRSQGSTRYRECFPALLAMASFPAEVLKPLTGLLDASGCRCARIYYECERLSFLAQSERRAGAQALLSTNIDPRCLGTNQPSSACAFPLVDAESTRLRRELEILPWIPKSDRRAILQRLAKLFEDPDAEDVARAAEGVFAIDVSRKIKKWLAIKLFRRIPKEDRVGFTSGRALRYLQRKHVKKLTTNAIDAAKRIVDDDMGEWEEKKVTTMLLNVDMIKKAMKVARSMDRENTRATTLAQISTRLKAGPRSDLLWEALNELASVRDRISRIRPALSIAKATHLLDPADSRRLVADWLLQLATLDRELAISELKQISIAAVEIEGLDGVHAMGRAVKRVTDWWN